MEAVPEPCWIRVRWITQMPVPLFAVTMGHAGLGLAWRSAHATFGLPAAVGEALMAFAAVAFALVALVYALKLMTCPGSVASDFRHPVTMNFFPAISIGLLLLAAGALPHAPRLAEALWVAGTILHLALAVTIIGRWIRQNTEIQHASPAWFIPVVGNIVVPIAGVPLGYETVSWFFFAVGLTFWVPLFTIVLYRLIFHDPLPPRIAPLLFILIAPPAAGFLAYMQLNGGTLDVLGYLLAASALFIALVLAGIAGLFVRLPFALSWWAFTFPAAALSCAMTEVHALLPSLATQVVAFAALAFATGIIALVTVRTLTALVTGRLF
ncbi:MAG: SLAC1 anion channel family protein [Rhodovibrio sp.]|nr:SLAC1 anion channel family protein [Rhodovibrio sp.]